MTIPQHLIFLIKWSKSSGEEKKSSICAHVLLSSSSGSITLAWVAVKCCVIRFCPSPGRPCHMCFQLSCEVCKFWCQNACVSWKYIVWKITLPLNNTYCQLPDFLKRCKILKMSCLEFQIQPIFSIICHNYLPSCQLHSCCPWNAETKICVNYLFCLIMLLWNGV